MIKQITEKIDVAVERWVKLSSRNYLAILLLTVILGLVMFLQASRIKLRSDFEAMLPPDFQSVKDLQRYQSEVGSTSTLSIALMTKDIPAAERFAEDLVRVIEGEMKGMVHYVEYNIADVRDFFKKNALLYMDLKELEEKYYQLEKYIGKRKLEKTGLLIDIDEEKDENKEGEEGKPPFDIEEYVKKYHKKAADFYGTREDGYFVSEKKEDILALIIYPRPGFSGVENSRLLITEIEKRIKKLNPAKYARDMTYGFAGPVRVGLDEYEAIKKDIVSTLGLCLVLIFIDLLIYFQRLRPIFFISFIVLYGLGVTLGLTKVVIGYLNAQTAFLGSIVAGTGINYPIIFIARYMEERKNGLSLMDSLQISAKGTWRATLSASLTTAVAFATLGLSKNLSFRHFGFIASSGVMIIWLFTVLFLPSLIVMSERIYPVIVRKKNFLDIPFVPQKFAWWIISRPGWVIINSTAVILVSAILIARWLPNSMEYNFSKLRNKMTFRSGVEAIDKRVVVECTRESTSPIVAITNSIEESVAYCDGIEKKKKENPERYGAGECKTLMSFLPSDQERKVQVINKFDELLHRNLKLLPEEYRAKYEQYRPMLQVKPIGLRDLPDKVRRKFRNIHGKEGVLALVYPEPGKVIWEYRILTRFVNTAREVITKDGQKITASGSPIIFYDIIKTVSHDAPRDTLYAIIGVFLIVFLIVGNMIQSLSIVFTLIVAVAGMMGIVAAFDIKINFFNFVAIPTAFGTGADYGINILMRYISEEKKNNVKDILVRSMVGTGGAVFLCSTTTIIGYFSLLMSNNQALVRYGELAMAGEVATLIAAIFLVPSLILKLKI